MQPRREGTFLWQGFEHEWLRTVAGFRVPHRISRLTSYVETDAPADSQSDVLSGIYHFAQSTGVDGNYMKPIGRYAALRNADISIRSESVRLTWTDESDLAQAVTVIGLGDHDADLDQNGLVDGTDIMMLLDLMEH